MRHDASSSSLPSPPGRARLEQQRGVHQRRRRAARARAGGGGVARRRREPHAVRAAALRRGELAEDPVAREQPQQDLWHGVLSRSVTECHGVDDPVAREQPQQDLCHGVLSWSVVMECHGVSWSG